MAKLYFRHAAINAGKSTALLQAAHNYEERGMRVRLFTASLDHRGGPGAIGSRPGLTRQVETFGHDTVFEAGWLLDDEVGVRTSSIATTGIGHTPLWAASRP